MDNQSLSHVRWKCQYHIVFIPKYRKKILYGKLKNDVREIISILCKYKDVQIIDGTVWIYQKKLFQRTGHMSLLTNRWSVYQRKLLRSWIQKKSF